MRVSPWAVVAATLVGGLLGRWSAPSAPPQVDDAPDPMPARLPSDVGVLPTVNVDCRACEATVDELQRRVAHADVVRAELETALYGTPPRWADDTPAYLRDNGVARLLRRVLGECAPNATWLGLDCDEPPCFGLFRVTSDDVRTTLEEDCPAWYDSFEAPPLAWRFRSQCTDGADEELLLALAPRDVFDYLVDEDGEPAKVKNRFRHRSTVLRDSWSCAKPSP